MAENMTMDAAAYTGNGTARERVPLPAELFDGTVNVPVMHQAVKAYLANQRQGNAATKTRGFVVGGNQKPWRQKGTGRARQGSIRAPHWVGGGTVFGPRPRSYAQYVPKQVRALARKSALNARAREGALLIVDRLEFDAPKTSRLAGLIARLGLDGEKVLLLTDGVKSNVFLSGRNLRSVHVMPYSDVSAYHVLWSDVVVIEGAALGHDLSPIAEEPMSDRPPRAAKPAKGKKSARAEKASREGGEEDAEDAETSTPKAARSKRGTAARKSAAKKSTAKSGGSTPKARKSAAKKSSSAKKKKGK
jgi:large subunit ribosomal protein L4